jgi:hypothetical protein
MVNDKARLRRPVLKRTKPIRSWATVVSPEPLIQSQIGPDLQNANRALEEQMRAGAVTARLFQAALGLNTGSGDSQDVTQRMVRAWSDLMSFWLEFVTRSTGGMAQATERATATYPQPAEPSKEPSSPEPLRVTVEIDCVRPAKVTVDLPLRARGSKLYVDRLHARGSNAPAITNTEIAISPDEHLVVIRLHIDPDQPAGVYNGVIVEEETSLPVGTISVEVQAGQDPSLSRVS